MMHRGTDAVSRADRLRLDTDWLGCAGLRRPRRYLARAEAGFSDRQAKRPAEENFRDSQNTRCSPTARTPVSSRRPALWSALSFPHQTTEQFFLGTLLDRSAGSFRFAPSDALFPVNRR